MESSIEFFSGIGAFAQAAEKRGLKVVAAFDQSETANVVYEANRGHKPSARNLDSISAAQTPDADVWWMSPPCTPYSRRGKQADENDPRASSLKNLIEIFRIKQPGRLFVENVTPFLESKMFERLKQALEENGYSYRTYELCPTMFGVPMKRPRVFVAASKGTNGLGALSNGINTVGAVPCTARGHTTLIPLKLFLEEDLAAWRRDAAAPERQAAWRRDAAAPERQAAWRRDAAAPERYIDSLNIVDPDDPNAIAICFTSGYGKSFKASGSFLRTADGARRFSPREIANLMGFDREFTFPSNITIQEQWRLLGNSVEARCIDWVLQNELQR